jgi:hypothetical protein
LLPESLCCCGGTSTLTRLDEGPGSSRLYSSDLRRAVGLPVGVGVLALDVDAEFAAVLRQPGMAFPVALGVARRHQPGYAGADDGHLGVGCVNGGVLAILGAVEPQRSHDHRDTHARVC